jgi:hypothetical protein
MSRVCRTNGSEEKYKESFSGKPGMEEAAMERQA